MDAYQAAQSMNMAYRGTPLPLLMAAREDIPPPDMPAEINMSARRSWFIGIGESVRNRDLIVDAVRQCISWIREML